MVNVRILGPLAAVGAAALAVPALVGCTADVQDDTGEDSQAASKSIAGSGEFVLRSYILEYKSTSGGDEFVRVGEKLKIILSVEDVVRTYGLPEDVADSLKFTARVAFTKADGSSYFADNMDLEKSGSTAKSNEFVVPEKTKKLRITILASYQEGGETHTVDLTNVIDQVQTSRAVFGAFLPDKLALFDSMGSSFRTRVLEGGGFVKGASGTIAVTDWRLDTIVDKVSLDLVVGQEKTMSRFGSAIVDLKGKLEYDVDAVISTDGGATFEPLTNFKQVTNSDLLPREPYRSVYQAQKRMPENASGVKIAFHVRAYVRVPENGVINPRYATGSRVLLKDVWDNNGGENYSIKISKK